MKKNRKPLLILFIGVFGLFLYASFQLLTQGRENRQYAVSVLVNDSSNARWSAFREGLVQGAQELPIYLNLVSTGEFSNLNEEKMALARELENGADGIILEPCDSDDADGNFSSQIDADSWIPVILAGSDMDAPRAYSAVLFDETALGKSIGESVVLGEAAPGENGGESVTSSERMVDLEEIRIGILTGNQRQSALRQRLQGLKAVLEETGAEIRWESSQAEQNTRKNLRSMFEQRPVDVLIALDNSAMEKGVDLLLQYEDSGCRLYGEGRSEKVIYYLDKGLITALTVPDEFYLGYLSIQELGRKLQKYDNTVEKITDVGFLTVTKETMYDEENSRVLFPAVQ